MNVFKYTWSVDTFFWFPLTISLFLQTTRKLMSCESLSHDGQKYIVLWLLYPTVNILYLYSPIFF